MSLPTNSVGQIQTPFCTVCTISGLFFIYMAGFGRLYMEKLAGPMADHPWRILTDPKAVILVVRFIARCS
jgi:hypothetical protein